MLALGCVSPQQSANNTTAPPVLSGSNGSAPLPNVTNASTGQKALPTEYTVSLGDNVSVIYALYVNGKLHDTNNKTLANDSGIYNPFNKYQPFNFTVQFNKDVINGFAFGVIGMRLNETVSFAVSPEDGYGPYDPKKVITIPRTYNKSLFETVPRSYFESQGISFTNGTTFETAFGFVSVVDFNEDNVTIFYTSLSKEGFDFQYNGVPQKVVDYTTFNSEIEYLLELNKTYIIPHPVTGVPTRYKVTEKTHQNITIDANHPLANETLYFVVTMVDIRPNKPY
jgi:FKBP-type peptidyl-prolyl cis-trans isomerase 2